MLTFYFVSKSNEPGGVQTLILNICKSYNRMNKRIKLITTNDSFVYNSAVESFCDFEWIDSKTDFSQKLTKDDVFVCFGKFGRDLKNLSKSDSKIFFWSVFPDDFINVFKIRNSIRETSFSNRNPLSYYLTKKLLRKLMAGNSAFFMDEIHIAVVQKYGLGGNLNVTHLLPIPVEIPMSDLNTGFKSIDRDIIHITYIGRAERWKILPFIKLLYDINDLKLDQGFKINVITDYSSKFIAEIDQLGITTGRIQIEYHEGLYGKGLYEFLVNNSHFVFTMGTSLLDSASLGIPTVVLDPCYKIPIETNIYRFLFEENGYCLGRPSWIMETPLGHSLSDILSVFSNETNYIAHSRKCKEYVQKNHSIEHIIKKIIQAEENTTTRISDLARFNYFFDARNILYSIFR